MKTLEKSFLPFLRGSNRNAGKKRVLSTNFDRTSQITKELINYFSRYLKPMFILQRYQLVIEYREDINTSIITISTIDWFLFEENINLIWINGQNKKYSHMKIKKPTSILS